MPIVRGKLKQLQTLSLGNGFNDEELMELAGLEQLRKLSFRRGDTGLVTPAGEVKLRKALPHLAIE